MVLDSKYDTYEINIWVTLGFLHAFTFQTWVGAMVESRETRLVFNEDPTEKPFRAEEVFNRLLAAPEVMGDGRW